VLTVVLAVAMVGDMAVTTLALARYTQRQQEIAPQNAVELFLDEHYGDARIETVYPGLEMRGN
jgi:hypothetical protein